MISSLSAAPFEFFPEPMETGTKFLDENAYLLSGCILYEPSFYTLYTQTTRHFETFLGPEHSGGTWGDSKAPASKASRGTALSNHKDQANTNCTTKIHRSGFLRWMLKFINQDSIQPTTPFCGRHVVFGLPHSRSCRVYLEVLRSMLLSPSCDADGSGAFTKSCMAHF